MLSKGPYNKLHIMVWSYWFFDYFEEKNYDDKLVLSICILFAFHWGNETLDVKY